MSTHGSHLLAPVALSANTYLEEYGEPCSRETLSLLM
jgi:hypothetical protein